MKTYSSQGKSGAEIHSIKCSKNNNILKVNKISNYYMKMRYTTNKYIYIVNLIEIHYKQLLIVMYIRYYLIIQ